MKLEFRALLIAVLMSGTACGPIYDTQYHYAPPKSYAGQACISQCEGGKYRCRSYQDREARDCERRSEYQAQICAMKIYDKKGRDPKWYECNTSSCSADYDLCDSEYRDCYESCGGRVTEQTVCIANCDQQVQHRQAPRQL